MCPVFTVSHHAIHLIDVNSNCVCVCQSLSCAWLFATPKTVAWQAPLSMGFSRQECWSGLTRPPPGDLPSPGRTRVSYISCIGRQVLYNSAQMVLLYLDQNPVLLASHLPSVQCFVEMRQCCPFMQSYNYLIYIWGKVKVDDADVNVKSPNWVYTTFK